MTLHRISRRRLLGAGLGLTVAAPFVSLAQEKYPSRPITLVVPFPPGGSVDIMARQYAEPLARILGTSVVIDNRPGAGGSVGSALVARAKPDGYTLVASSQSSHLANPLTQPNLSYDPIADFENIAILGRQPNALMVHESLPVDSLKALVDYANARPGQVNFGSAGVGSMGQLNVELLKSVTGIDATHVPYRGGAPLVTAALTNEVQFILDNLVFMLPHVQSGKVRALAVAADTRLAQLPDVPTFAELGYPQLNLTSWTGIAAPKGTPHAIVQAVYQAVRQAAEDPKMAAILAERGVIVPEPMAPADFESMMAERLVSYGDVVRKAGIQAE